MTTTSNGRARNTTGASTNCCPATEHKASPSFPTATRHCASSCSRPSPVPTNSGEHPSLPSSASGVDVREIGQSQPSCGSGKQSGFGNAPKRRRDAHCLPQGGFGRATAPGECYARPSRTSNLRRPAWLLLRMATKAPAGAVPASVMQWLREGSMNWADTALSGAYPVAGGVHRTRCQARPALGARQD